MLDPQPLSVNALKTKDDYLNTSKNIIKSDATTQIGPRKSLQITAVDSKMGEKDMS